MARLINGWEVVIGLEVHAQIATQSKLFSSSPTSFGADPNEHVSFYDAAMPGMLPVLNEYAVDQAIKTGLAINGTVNKISQFDRKNYFYPDLPSGYQISQLFHPIVSNGYIDILDEDSNLTRINIERIHIEQDAGKSVHDLDKDHSYIDLNRAGIPLMEIVSKPDIRSAYEAMQYLKKLRMILRYIGSCNCNMEQGNLRADANVSVHKTNTPFGNRAEIKNINSIKFLGDAINYEVQRQIYELESGRTISQETRLFDAHTGQTRTMRSKEDAADYRYFPDPDLKQIILTSARINKVKSELPELPDIKKSRFVEKYHLTPIDAAILVEDRCIADDYERAVKASQFPDKSSKLIANWLIGDVFAILNKENKNISDLLFPIEYIAALVDLIVDRTISGKIAKTVFAEMNETGKHPRDIVAEKDCAQIVDPNVITEVSQKVISANLKQFEQYKSGKTQLFGFFVGQIMKELHGKGNPDIIHSVLTELLNK